MNTKNYTVSKNDWSGESVDFRANDTRLICKEYDKDLTIVSKIQKDIDGDSKYDCEWRTYTDKFDGTSYDAFKWASEKEWTVLDDDFNNHTLAIDSECSHTAVVQMICNRG